MEQSVDIPEELLRYELLIRFDPLSLLKYCKASKKAEKYCNDSTFMKKYNKTISHDDYQLLVLKEAHKGNVKSFFTLKDKAEFFDQIVDRRTIDRAIIYFSELTDIEFDQKISDVMYYSPDIRRGVDNLRTIIKIMQTDDPKVNPQYEERIWNLFYDAFHTLRDNEYIGSFLINNLTTEETVIIFKIIKQRARGALHAPGGILGTLLKNNDLNLFNLLMDTTATVSLYSKDLLMYSVTKYGTLDQYKSILGNKIADTGYGGIIYDRDLYLYLVKNQKNPSYSGILNMGYYALDPYEWIYLIKRLKNDKDSDKYKINLQIVKDNLQDIIRSSYNAGYTYWSKSVKESNLKEVL